MSFTEDIIEELKKLGFNEYQAKIYTALVGLGVATASEISQASGVPPNKVYSVIDSLKKRGLVLAQESDTSTNRYRPRSPDLVVKDLRNEYEQAFQKTEEKLFTLYERSKKAFIPEMWILRGAQAVFSKIKEMVMDANTEIYIGIDSPFDLHLHGLDQVLQNASGHLKSIKIITGEEGIDNPGEINVLKTLNNFSQIRISENFHAIWVIIDSKEILQGAYAQLEGGIELGIMATWSDNQSFSELWQKFSNSLWESAKAIKEYKLW
ncbi:MAG TPA: helix-turn-helix domain-containing protein [candidate division Zixibacteria bacterium]|nr:helix-turn-helix domain-containing protein [candidate division Zixibacteria bacterium]